MSRTARVVLPGIPHHITQRGTRRFDVFRNESDRLDYLALFRESCREFLLRIVAYCLMTNHVHYIAIPERPDSIHRVFHRVQGTYSKRFNIKHGFVGHLWQERPFSCVLDETHLWNAIRYVERNPVRAGMVAGAADYPWSSARAHCHGEADPFLDVMEMQASVVNDWSSWLAVPDNSDTIQLIRNCTATGRPCGNDAFVKKVGETANRDFTRKKRGPKPRATAEKDLLLDWSGDQIIS